MKKVLKIATLVSVIFSAGCATIVSDSSYPVIISSEPSGQSFEIRNRDGVLVSSGTTPYSVLLKSGAGYFKKEIYEISFTSGKYKGRKFTLEAKVDGWYAFGNLVFGGLLGYLVVDPLTGAMYKLPKQFMISLDGGVTQEALHILPIDSLTAEQREHLEPIDIEG